METAQLYHVQLRALAVLLIWQKPLILVDMGTQSSSHEPLVKEGPLIRFRNACSKITHIFRFSSAQSPIWALPCSVCQNLTSPSDIFTENAAYSTSSHSHTTPALSQYVAYRGVSCDSSVWSSHVFHFEVLVYPWFEEILVMACQGLHTTACGVTPPPSLPPSLTHRDVTCQTAAMNEQHEGAVGPTNVMVRVGEAYERHKDDVRNRDVMMLETEAYERHGEDVSHRDVMV